MKFTSNGRRKLLGSICVDLQTAGEHWGEDVILKVYADAARWAQLTEDFMADGYYFEDAIERAFKVTETNEERVWLETILVDTWTHGEELRELRLHCNPILRKPSFIQRMRFAFSRSKGMVFAK